MMKHQMNAEFRALAVVWSEGPKGRTDWVLKFTNSSDKGSVSIKNAYNSTATTKSI